MAGIKNQTLFGKDLELTRTSSGRFQLMNDGIDAFGIYNNAGSPEGVVAADIGSLCCDTSTGDLYRKTTDTVATGWVIVGGVSSLLGRSGSKVTSSSGVFTVKSPTYADAGASGTSVLNTGEFVTGAFTRTLPVSAGLIDGDLIEFVCTSASALVIQAVGSQTIRLGNTVSSAAGTATSTAIGDSLSLRFRATDEVWYTTSSQGNWTLA